MFPRLTARLPEDRLFSPVMVPQLEVYPNEVSTPPGFDAMSPEEKTQILSRIAALEYLLEMGYATWVAQMTDAEIDEFQRDFETRLATTWVASQVDPFIGRTEFDEDVIREAQGLAIRFWKRVREREAAIRAKRRG
jgi:hypothetical protein